MTDNSDNHLDTWSSVALRYDVAFKLEHKSVLSQLQVILMNGLAAGTTAVALAACKLATAAAAA
jgi:hypothetical protein